MLILCFFVLNIGLGCGDPKHVRGPNDNSYVAENDASEHKEDGGIGGAPGDCALDSCDEKVGVTRDEAHSGAQMIDTEKWEIEFSNVDANGGNGVSYERAILHLNHGQILYVPSNAHVEEGGQCKDVKINVAKQLSFGGYPPGRMHIQNVRRCVGIAYKESGNSVSLGTYGEWDSQIEGGVFIGMAVCVPPDIKVELREKLSGEDSRASDNDIRRLFAEIKNPALRKGHCSSRRRVAQSWVVIKTEPDRERRCPPPFQ